MDYPKFIVWNQKGESISIQRVKTIFFYFQQDDGNELLKMLSQKPEKKWWMCWYWNSGVVIIFKNHKSVFGYRFDLRRFLNITDTIRYIYINMIIRTFCRLWNMQWILIIYLWKANTFVRETVKGGETWMLQGAVREQTNEAAFHQTNSALSVPVSHIHLSCAEHAYFSKFSTKLWPKILRSSRLGRSHA